MTLSLEARRLASAKGGRARAQRMTAQERSEAARRAVQARWKFPWAKHLRHLRDLRQALQDLPGFQDHQEPLDALIDYLESLPPRKPPE